MIAFQWALLHGLGVLATDWADKAGIRGHDGLVIFIGGYISTVLLLFAITFGLQRFLRWKRKRSAGVARLTSQL